jgi:pilus assembly protein CpaE
VATNLAIHLHRLTGKKVLLVDLDLELGEIALFLGTQPRFNFVDLVRNFHRMDAELLASYIEAHSSGVHLLSAPYHPEKVEAVDGDQIRAILSFLKQHYDYVVVDTSKSFSPATLASFEQADQIYFVSNIDLPSLRNIKRCLPLLERVTGGVENRVRLVVNRFNSANEITLDEVEKTLGIKVFWKLANDYEVVMRSINSGEPLVLEGRDAGFAHDLRALGAEISGFGAVSNGKRGPLDGLRRLLSPSRRTARETSK